MHYHACKQIKHTLLSSKSGDEASKSSGSDHSSSAGCSSAAMSTLGTYPKNRISPQGTNIRSRQCSFGHCSFFEHRTWIFGDHTPAKWIEALRCDWLKRVCSCTITQVSHITRNTMTSIHCSKWAPSYQISYKEHGNESEGANSHPCSASGHTWLGGKDDVLLGKECRSWFFASEETKNQEYHRTATILKIQRVKV